MSSLPPWASDDHRLVVGVGDFRLAQGEKVLTTHGLGSCIGIAAIHYGKQWGALLHYQRAYFDGSMESPARYGDTGIPLMMREIEKMGWVPHEAKWAMVGGASTTSTGLAVQIARENIQVARSLLRQQGITQVITEIGGDRPRTLHVDLVGQEIRVDSPGTKPIRLLYNAGS